VVHHLAARVALDCQRAEARWAGIARLATGWRNPLCHVAGWIDPDVALADGGDDAFAAAFRRPERDEEDLVLVAFDESA